ncbi:MAG: potassium channel family protein [Thermomicrobiales bacterium]|nr:potassium channel family protein [Thermomicrobiales bacterium]
MHVHITNLLAGTPKNSDHPSRDSRLRHGGTLMRPGNSLARSLGLRLALAASIVLVVTLAVYAGRHGFADNSHPGEPLSLVDSVYYAATSLTTVGYGDIVPVTPQARLLNSVLLTPVRLFFLILFFGTAYEVSVYVTRRAQEREVHDLNKQLDHHTIICGYGTTGRAAARTLLSQGKPKRDILVIDRMHEAVERALADGFSAFLGDATEEATWRHAAVNKAESVLVAPGRDDTAVLICLTVNNIEPEVNLVVAGMEEENLKLLYQAGADRVIAPAVMGGRLMAAASETQSVPWFVQQLIGQGWSDRKEYRVTAADAGQTIRELPGFHDVLVLGVSRPPDLICDDLDTVRLRDGDTVIYYELTVQDAVTRRMTNNGAPT